MRPGLLPSSICSVLPARISCSRTGQNAEQVIRAYGRDNCLDTNQHVSAGEPRQSVYAGLSEPVSLRARFLLLIAGATAIAIGVASWHIKGKEEALALDGLRKRASIVLSVGEACRASLPPEA